MSAAVYTAPVRPDLADVAPIYYPIIEQHRFGSVAAMVRRMGWPAELVGEYMQRAQVERSGCVVIDRLILGDPEFKMCAVLVMQPGGAVVLCAGLIGAASEDQAAVRELAAEFAAAAGFAGKLIAVGEFRPNPKGALQ
jgi:hypothetical protein